MIRVFFSFLGLETQKAILSVYIAKKTTNQFKKFFKMVTRGGLLKRVMYNGANDPAGKQRTAWSLVSALFFYYYFTFIYFHQLNDELGKIEDKIY